MLDSRHQRKDKRPQPKMLSSLDYDRDKMSVMKDTRLTLNDFEFRDNSKPETRNSQLKPNKEKVSSNAMQVSAEVTKR